MKKLNLILFGILLSAFLFAQQNTANIWYFAEHAGVSFNTGVPVALIDGQTDIIEGCATICDENGNLLFYTDGINIWNKNHQVMPNGSGLMGNPSATQSAIITPYPINDSLLYVFTIDAAENHLQNGLRYSIVDMNLDSGLGDVTSTKNVLLENPVTEKLTSVIHTQGTNIWLIAHRWDSDEFIAYEISSTGIDTIPVVSSIGTIHQGGYSPNPTVNGWVNAAGYMKSNIQGTKIALAIMKMDKFELFDFDKSTGILSNYYVSETTYDYSYGVEFSPDGSMLYGSALNNSKIYQFDLTSPTPLSSSTIIGSSSTYEPSALQLGPNGKIYVALKNNDYLGVIDKPNNIGTSCDFIHDAVYLDGKISKRGFPSLFYDKDFQFFTGSVVDMSMCTGDSIYLENSYQTTSGTYYDTLQSSLGWDSILTINLNFYNSTSATINQIVCDTYISPSGNYNWTSSGTYTDTVLNAAGCDSIITINLSVNNSTGTTINQTVCDFYTSPSGNYTWTSSGTYFDTIPNSIACDSIIIVNLIIRNSTSATVNQAVCNSYISPSGNYTWTNSGTYNDTIPNVVGCDSIITINLIINTVDTSVSQFGITLFANASGAIYQWVDCDNSFASIAGETNQSFTPTTNGNYAVIVNQNNCTDISYCYSIISIGFIEYSSNKEVLIYPNPTNGKITLQAKGIERIEVMDLQGRMIKYTVIASKAKQSVNNNEIATGYRPRNDEIDLSSQAKGIYIIKVTTEKGVAVGKVVLE